MLAGGQKQSTPGGGGLIFGRWGSAESLVPADLGPLASGGSPCSRRGSIGAVWDP